MYYRHKKYFLKDYEYVTEKLKQILTLTHTYNGEKKTVLHLNKIYRLDRRQAK